MLDAELSARVLQLINVTDTGLHSQVIWQLYISNLELSSEVRSLGFTWLWINSLFFFYQKYFQHF